MSSIKLEIPRGEMIADKYEVVDRLDENPLGYNYRVKHLKSGRYVRLCLLRPKIAGRQHKDAIVEAFQLAKNTKSPHLLKVGELGDHSGIAYFTYEDFKGITLRELIQEYKISGNQFALQNACQIIRQILESLATAHDSGFVFRALRPEYVMVNMKRAGPRQNQMLANVKLFGFGFWNLVPTAMLAEDEFSRGEAQYQAPELKGLDPTPTTRCDLYSTGVMFYELLVGQGNVGSMPLPRQYRPELPLHIDNIVELAVAVASEDRYQTAIDFSKDIQRTFEEGLVSDDFRQKKKPSPMPWVFVMGCVLLVGLATIVLNLKQDPEVLAATADAQLRLSMAENHAKPTQAEVDEILKAHPGNMVYIPAGEYISGRMNNDPDARTKEPLTEVVDLEAYLIDAFEYPNLKNSPVEAFVRYDEAEASCISQGKRLCTSWEWEKACKGPENAIYSYGDTYDPEYCGQGLDDVAAAGQKEQCRSGWGVFDVSGNYQEWTNTPYQGKQERRIVKDGMPGTEQAARKGTRCTFSTDHSTGHRDTRLSFRCCKNAF